MPHRGSARTATRKFLDALTADVNIVSADGRYGNPDYECLVNVVESAHEARLTIELAMTNDAPSYDQLLKTHPPKQFAYASQILNPAQSILTVDVGMATN